MEIGIRGEATTVVDAGNTALSAMSGGLAVYATPYMIALMESAAYQSVQPMLDEGETTVGTRMNIAHTAATPPGMRVRAESELVAVDGRKLVFAVRAYDEVGEIGAGEHERFIVRTEKFMARANARGHA